MTGSSAVHNRTGMIARVMGKIGEYNTTPEKRTREFEDHIATTYSKLRRGMAILAWLFPFTLWWFGNVFGIELLDSMSAYYYTPADRLGLRIWPAAAWLLLWIIGSYVVYIIGAALFAHPKNTDLAFREVRSS